jgi:hypothetical protein
MENKNKVIYRSAVIMDLLFHKKEDIINKSREMHVRFRHSDGSSRVLRIRGIIDEYGWFTSYYENVTAKCQETNKWANNRINKIKAVWGENE